MTDLQFHFGSDDFGDRFVYHYTSASAMHMILHSRKLRLGPLASCNDPRERKEIYLTSWSIQGDPPVDFSRDEWKVFEADMELELRGSKYLACLTYDRPGGSDHGNFERGFGRARNWSQYGDDHRGACMVFDRAVLEEAVRRWVGTHDGCQSSYRSGAVHYRDMPIRGGDELTIGLGFSARSLVKGARVRADEMWEESDEELFFEKATDWESEREYRIVVQCRCGNAPLVDIRGALVGIALGEHYSQADLVLLRERVERADLLPIAPATVRWTAGAPYADLLPGTERGDDGPLFAWR